MWKWGCPLASNTNEAQAGRVRVRWNTHVPADYLDNMGQLQRDIVLINGVVFDYREEVQPPDTHEETDDDVRRNMGEG